MTQTVNISVNKDNTTITQDNDGRLQVGVIPISKVANLQAGLDLRAPLASPALTGTPTAPTASAGTNTTQVATTEFVMTQTSSITSNTTYNIGATGDFASLTAFNTFIATKTIANSAIVTVNFQASYDGTEASDVVFNHPQSSQIQIIGNAVSTNITAFVSSSGSIGNQSVTYTVADATGIAVGDYGIIDNETTTSDENTTELGSHSGCWVVTAVSGNNVTINNVQQMRTALVGTHFSTARFTKCTKVNAQINFDNVQIRMDNIIAYHDANKPIMKGANGFVKTDGFIGVGSSSSSANAGYTVFFDNFDVLSVTYDTTFGYGNIGLSSVFACGGKSSFNSGGYLARFNSIFVKNAVFGSGISIIDNQFIVNNKYGAMQLNGVMSSMYNDNSCNTKGFAANHHANANVSIFTKQVSNNNQTNANNTTVGSYFIQAQYVGNNGGSGNQFNNGVGFITNQFNCSNNTLDGNACDNLLRITNQFKCDNNGATGNLGNIVITNMTSCTGNVIANNRVGAGQFIRIGGGTAVTSGQVADKGTGMIMKLGTSPFTITALPTAQYSGITNRTATDTIAAGAFVNVLKTNNNQAMTLPALAGVNVGDSYVVKVLGALTGCTVIPATGEKIDDVTDNTINLSGNSTYTFVKESSTNWILLN